MDPFKEPFKVYSLIKGFWKVWVPVLRAEGYEHLKTIGAEYLSPKKVIVEARKLEHSFRRISARIPYTLP